VAVQRARGDIAERMEAACCGIRVEQPQVDEIDIDRRGKQRLRFDQRVDDLAEIFGTDGFHPPN
jgi:hypothetical protein